MTLRDMTTALAMLLAAVVGSVSTTALGDVSTPALGPGRGHISAIDGQIASAAADQGRFLVTLYQFDGTRLPGVQATLARTVSDEAGTFRLTFRDRQGADDSLFLTARRGALLYATVLPSGSLPRQLVVNELTTVATAFTLAQFISPRGIAGYDVGIRNGVRMAGNFVAAETGKIASVLATTPNGPATTTVARFNTLANVLAGCARQHAACTRLFRAARGAVGRPPAQTLQAMVEIARHPWRTIDEIFALSQIAMPPYTPALGEAPSAWTLPIVFNGVNKGSGTINVLNGPGNFAFDADGNANIGINYQPSPGPGQENVPVCAGTVFVRFAPDGSFAPGSPFSGGGLDGVGFGVALDPEGRVWLTNFGFAGEGCPLVPSSDSVSVFTAEGRPLSREDGITAGELSWPQGITSSRLGDIWITSCRNGNVSIYPNGNPRRAKVVPASVSGLEKPFAVAIDPRGRTWVTGNKSSSVAVFDRHGRPVPFSPITGRDLNLPLGIASDSRGNMWVANSVVIEAPCPDGLTLPEVEPGTLTLIRPDGSSDRERGFEGGGLSIPWGVAIDGLDNVWVANFGSDGAGPDDYVGRISQFCGADRPSCPPGLETGDPISPDTG